MKKLVSMVMVLSVLSSCASSTIIRSSDHDAKIYVDGEYAGQGFAPHSDSKTAFGNSVVRIEKPGCKDMTYNLPRGQEFQVGPFIAGFFLLVPFLWVSGYKGENTYEFVCNKK